MTTGQRVALWTASLVAGVSGLAYAAMKYLLPRTDPFSAYGHPLQPHALKLHVLAVPVLIFIVGWIFGAHAQYQLRGGEPRGRRSGWGILGLTVLLSLSGYLVQAFADAPWRPAAAWVHGLSGIAFVAALAGHALRGRRARAASPRAVVVVPHGSSAHPRPGYLRPLAFPRTESGRVGAPSASPPDSGLGCGGCRGCSTPLFSVPPKQEAAGGRADHSRANRD